MKCPVPHCRHTMKVHSLTRNDLYFCKCTDSEVLKVSERGGFYGGTVKVLEQTTEEERAEFLSRLPREQWPQAPFPPDKEIG